MTNPTDKTSNDWGYNALKWALIFNGLAKVIERVSGPIRSFFPDTVTTETNPFQAAQISSPSRATDLIARTMNPSVPTSNITLSNSTVASAASGQFSIPLPVPQAVPNIPITIPPAVCVASDRFSNISLWTSPIDGTSITYPLLSTGTQNSLVPVSTVSQGVFQSSLAREIVTGLPRRIARHVVSYVNATTQCPALMNVIPEVCKAQPLITTSSAVLGSIAIATAAAAAYQLYRSRYHKKELGTQRLSMGRNQQPSQVAKKTKPASQKIGGEAGKPVEKLQEGDSNSKNSPPNGEESKPVEPPQKDDPSSKKSPSNGEEESKPVVEQTQAGSSDSVIKKRSAAGKEDKSKKKKVKQD